tara:strand:+ start:11986 stop:12222 length:237 start_codon:yes stop_codon:yes gene_type:complete
MALGLIIIFFTLIVSSFVFWIWMLIDCIRRDFEKDDEKIVWLLVVILVQIIGAIIYYFVIKRKDKKTKGGIEKSEKIK